jgi:hypothetical protein
MVMRRTFRALIAVAVLVGLSTPLMAEEQQPPRDPALGSIRVTVLDQQGAAILGATVTVAMPPPAEPQSSNANERGEVVFENLPPGKYVVRIESPGFETADLADVNVRRGRQERKEVRLEIGRFVEEVEVKRNQTDEVLNDAFSSALTQEQIDALPDDEEEMAEQLQQMAGPGATLRVNGFSGGRLPPKSQIAEIRFRFDPYSAENHESGFPRVDIRTRPGNGNWRNSAGFTFRDESLNATNAFAPTKGAEQARRYQWSVDGPIVKGRTSFSLNVGGLDQYETETILVSDPATGEVVRGLVTQPVDRVNFNARVEHAINKNQLLRLEYSRNGNSQGNLGVGQFDLPTRAYDSESLEHEVRISNSGSLGKLRNEARFSLEWDDSSSTSLLDEVTVRVQDTFTSGGAQVRGGRTSKVIEFADNMDFSLGKKHALRSGVLLEGGWYRGDEARNYLGTFTFSGDSAFELQRPLQFSQRVGDPLVEYAFWQLGAYIQDDIRVRKNVMVSAGLRYEAQTHVGDALNVAPRAHVTWSPFKSNRTTIRAGAGVFYDWFEDSLYEQSLRLDGVRQRDIIIRNPGYPDPTEGGAREEQLPPSVTRVSSAIVLPTIHRASVGVEHAVTGWMQLRGNYFTQRSTDVFRAVNTNAPIDGVRPDSTVGNVSFIDSIGRARSQGVDMSVSLNYAPKRIFGTINYRLARANSDGESATSLPVDGTNLAAEWGPTRNDVRHRIFGFVSTPLFFGLRTNVNARYESAMPYNITTGFDNNGDSVINDRPAGVGRNAARADDHLNVDFRLSWTKGLGKPKTGDGQPGGPQVVVRGPDGGGRGPGGGGRGGPGGGGGGPMVMMGGGGPGGQPQGRVNLEIFAQVFNLLNDVNYRTYSGVMTSEFFGQPTSADMPRRIELGMRVTF